MSGIPDIRHFFLDEPTPDKFRVIFGRYGGRYRWEFDTLAEAIEWVKLVEDSDEQFIAYIEDPQGDIISDNRSLSGWEPSLESVS